nr:histidine kinase dimerization/phospho-acceptor domain-containing protein [uncultured Desulfobacter sp.]
MIQSEKILSVGGLAAGMAHEINNPLAGMMQSANVVKNRLEDIAMPANLRVAKKLGISMEDIRAFMEKREIFRMLDAIHESGSRAAEIVSNMLSFARKSDASISSHYPDQLMDESLELAATDYDLKKQYDFKSIEIIKAYVENLPMLLCEGAKIQQVLLNILRNTVPRPCKAQAQELQSL